MKIFKNQCLLVFSLVFLSTIIQSCEKNDDTPKDAFTYQSINYEISHGFYDTEISSFSNQNETSIVLASSEVSYNENTEKFEGAGSSIFLILEHTSDELEEGVYYYSTGGDKDLDDGIVTISGVVGQGSFIKDGKVTIEKKNRKTVVTIEVLMSGDNAVIGHYEGVLEEVQFDF